ncbi:MAG: TIR domain-containing protein [Rhodomicrobium sp.]
MADVFISYARQDRQIAADLAYKLEAEGWSVWWDQDLIAERRHLPEIDGQIAQAGVVLCIWTENSVRSEWVLDEARLARASRKLIPIKVPGLAYNEIPFGFQDINTADVGNFDEIRAAIRSRGVWPEHERPRAGFEYRKPSAASSGPTYRYTDRFRLAKAIFGGIFFTCGVLVLAYNFLDEKSFESLRSEKRPSTLKAAQQLRLLNLDIVDLNVLYSGSDMQGTPIVLPTSSDCSRECKTRAGCKAFSYIDTDQLCHLKSTVTGQSAHEGTISGAVAALRSCQADR